MTLLSVADRLATRGDRAEQAIAAHLSSPARCSATRCAGAGRGRRARCCAATSWRASSASRRPALGELLEALAAAQYAGELATRDEALASAQLLEQSCVAAGAATVSQARSNRIRARMTRPRLHLLQDRRRRAAGHDRRRRRAHARVHGHRPGHARARARDPARAQRRPAERRSRGPAARSRSPPSGWRGRAKQRLGADGVNLLNSCGAAAWQTVFHFHVHVIPRYEGDPLRLPWVPAAGDPDEIAAAAQELGGG